MKDHKSCRFCSAPLTHSFCNLGKTPLSNAYLTKEQLDKQEPIFDLHAYVCDKCLLVQLEEVEKPEAIFSDYAYFSSYSSSWLQHAREYVEMMCSRFQLSSQHQVIEIASNDGYLLQYFKEHQIPILGIEPARNVADVAINKGIPTLVKFFGTQTAHELAAQNRQADVLLGNNVFAHVPNLNDFVAGFRIILKKEGVITLEFPHLLQLMQLNQFDTIYHEHFSYFSLYTVEKIFAAHGLALFDVEELSTHGGSLRVFVQHAAYKRPINTTRIEALRQKERLAGLHELSTYLNFQRKIDNLREEIRAFFFKAQSEGKTIAGYGAPAKGNTLLNFCGIDPSLLTFTVDISPHKQNRFLPGTHIPIHAPAKIYDTKPDYLFILPWNLEKEIREQMQGIQEWGGRFVIPIPHLQLVK